METRLKQINTLGASIGSYSNKKPGLKLKRLETNKALAQVWKLIINSAYGFWGTLVVGKDSVLIQEKSACDIHVYINRGKFLNYTEIGKYGIAFVLKNLPIKDFI